MFNRIKTDVDYQLLAFALAGLFLAVVAPGIFDLYVVYTQPGSLLAMSGCS